jgi:adenosylmethionine-8-amino-7-oxononanoate aminotransferase
MVVAFDVKTDDALFARRFAERATGKELLLRPIGNTVYFMPPYVISDEEIDLLASRTLETLEEIA